MRIGELAGRTGISTKTIRYYEEIGVLPIPGRSANGYRQYSEESVDRIRFIKDAQLTGLTLEEIATVVDLRGRGAPTCEHVIALLDLRLEEIDARIATLEKTRRNLTAIRERARRLDPTDCSDPIRCQTIVPAQDLGVD